MSTIPETYYVERIPDEQTHEWLLKKHYMHRVPAIIIHSFAMYERATKIMVGVCTYSLPARGFNDGYGVFGKDETYKVPTFELSRLCVDDGLPRNALSFFVSKTFRFFDHPTCLVSYADGNSGHHGYIYQATNWLYCGIAEASEIFMDKRTGKPIHRRTLSDMLGEVHLDSLPEWIDLQHEAGGKFRYFQLLGDKKQKAEMRKRLTWKVEPYPKGDNERYDSSYKPNVQLPMF